MGGEVGPDHCQPEPPFTPCPDDRFHISGYSLKESTLKLSHLWHLNSADKNLNTLYQLI